MPHQKRCGVFVFIKLMQRLERNYPILNMKHFIKPATIFLMLILAGCSTNFKVPEEKFIGLWELKGRSMFDGIQIRIEKEDGTLKGKIVKLNDNKLVKMFSDINDVWISEIKRTSNSEFKIIEKKIAKDLFALYGISTTQEFSAEFIDDKTIGLGTGISSAKNSKLLYVRID